MKKDSSLGFTSKARKIHGDKYDYSKVIYSTNCEKVCITCPKHGDFWQTPNHHLRGCGCPICTSEERRESEKKSFIDRASKIHDGKYDYFNVNYINNHTKVAITCPKHGDFMQTPKMHIFGNGCPLCGQEHKSMVKIGKNSELFIPRARKIHGDKYDYSKSVYDGHRKEVCIICPIHGEFWQTPDVHLHGGNCPRCNQSKLEEDVDIALNCNGIKYKSGKRFPWLGLQHLDFYLPEHKIAIECQGDQHYKPIEYFGGEKSLRGYMERDARKLNRCNEHGIKILYYSKSKLAPKETFKDTKELIEYIKSNDRHEDNG